MIPIVAILAIAIVWAIFRYFHSKKQLSSKKIVCLFLDEKLTDYAVTLLFTVCGVLFALMLTNMDAANTNQSNAAIVLNALEQESREVEGHITEFFLPEFLQMHYAGVDDEKILYLYNAQPIVPVVAFSIALNSELVITNINPSVYAALISAYRSSITSFGRLQNVTSVDILIYELEVLRDTMVFTQAIIGLQLDYPTKNAERMQVKISKALHILQQ